MSEAPRTEIDPRELVAFKGEIEIVDAAWSLDSGRTVSVRLCGEAFDRLHPFKQFQKRRNGRVGTRFKAILARLDNGEVWLEAEFMLCDWKDSASMGQVVTFWLDNEPAIHPFAFCERRKGQQVGDLFAIVLVELNDDDTPVNQRQRADLERGAAGSETPPMGSQDPPPSPGSPGAGAQGRSQRTPTAPRKLSSSVHLLTQRPRYVQWLKETKPNIVKEWTPSVARVYTKRLLSIESLSELDRNPKAVERYYALIRKPYDRWLHQEP